MDSDFEQKVDYLKEINGYKNKSDTIRRTVEKEYQRNEPFYKWTLFTSFAEWEDWESGPRLATIQNRFGQTFLTEVYLYIDINKPCWCTRDIKYAENWKEGDFKLSHNWKVVALMPVPTPYRIEATKGRKK